MERQVPIQTLHMFSVLDKMLIELLRSLTPEEWHAQTVAKLWKVKDVASHLLDGNIRTVSIIRDGYYGEKPDSINSYQDLVSFLNDLNMSWTSATKRISPEMLTMLLEVTGKPYVEHLQSLKPFDHAAFSVAWAGEDVSENWFHIAREYTEKFLHQQQIRDAVGKLGLLTREFFYPFIDILMYGLPHTFRNVSTSNGTIVTIAITTDIGGEWSVVREENNWLLKKGLEQIPTAKVFISPNLAWKLFSKSLRPDEILSDVEIQGDDYLAKQALQMVSVMA